MYHGYSHLLIFICKYESKMQLMSWSLLQWVWLGATNLEIQCVGGAGFDFHGPGLGSAPIGTCWDRLPWAEAQLP